MFNLSTLLTKPMVIAIIALSGLSLSLFAYSYLVKSKNTKLQRELTLTNATLVNLNASLIKERELHNNTLTALQLREKQRDIKTLEATRLRSKLTEILRNYEDTCLNEDLPEPIIDLFTKRVQPLPEDN